MFVIWCGIVLLCAVAAFAGWYVRQLWIGHAELRRENEQILVRLTSIDRWAGAFVAHSDKRSIDIETRTESLNKRLAALETENRPTKIPKAEESDDPFSGPRSWAAQAAAAERGEGVRVA